MSIRTAPAVSKSISVYVNNTRCGEFFLHCDLNNFFHIILYTHVHTQYSHTAFAFIIYRIYGAHTHICVWVRMFTRACVCMCVYRYCIVGTWSRTWSLGIRREYKCVWVCVYGSVCVYACVDGREKGRPHSRAGSLPPKQCRNVVGSWPRPPLHPRVHNRQPLSPATAPPDPLSY